MKKLRILLVGFGFMGQTHAGNILKEPLTELAGIVDCHPPAERLRSIRGNTASVFIRPEDVAGVPHYTDMGEAFERSEADACIVALPTKLHCPAVLRALEHGLHVMVEKPFAVREEECREMVQAAEKAGKVLAVGYIMRHSPEALRLRQYIRDHTLGDLKFMLLRRMTGMPDWGDWRKAEFIRESGGGLFDLMSHDIDFARFSLGEPEDVSVDPLVGEAFGGNLISAVLQYPGCRVWIQGGFVTPSGYPFRKGYDAWFENGALQSSGSGSCTLIRGSEVLQERMEPCSSYRNELHGFAEAVLSGDLSGICSGADAAETVRLCHRIAGKINFRGKE